jgi:small subunit ribosomal protein S22
MTDTMLEEARARMKDRASKFLQFVPLKEPRTDTFQILAKDSEIDGFDTSRYVFTDITFDATNQDRTVVIREPAGTLRTALPEEHDRMNRVYYEQPNRPPFPPPVFKDPDLKNALDSDKHEFVLDYATWFYEPDDPAFVHLCHTIFDRTVTDNKFQVLYSTRHFGSLLFYLVINDNIPPILNFYGSMGSLRDAANIIRLQKIVFPNWRTAIGFNDSDEKICRDFIQQNKRFKDDIPALMKLLEATSPLLTPSNTDNKPSAKPQAKQSGGESRKMKSRATVNRENVRTEEGPLGQLSEEYQVKIAKDERDQRKPSSNESDKKKQEFKQPTTTSKGAGRRQKISTYKERLAEIEREKNKKD